MPSARPSDFVNLPFQEKLEFLYGLPARQKRDLILASPEAERLVQSFAPDTLFYTLKEIGIADASDLLSMAVPEQVRWLFDLDCWDKDRPNFKRVGEWVEALSESGRKRMAEGLMELDLELVALLLRRYLRVYRLDDPQMLPDAPSDHFVQFDEHYLIEFTRYDTLGAHIQEFLEEAFERDYNYFAGLMEELFWGVEAELEEQAYQFRATRLADRGFPDYFEAQDIFAYVNPQRFLEIRGTYPAPSRADRPDDLDLVPPHMAPVAGDADHSLFNTALTAGFAAQGKRQLRSEMAMVSNQVLVARSVDFGDLDAVRVAVEMTHDYLNLALEHLAGGELKAAIEHLSDTHLKLLFRLGVSLTIDLRTRAEGVVTALGFTPDASRDIGYLDSPYREALAGFLERQPRFCGALDRGGAVAMRNFRAIRDLHLSYGLLEQINTMPELFRALLTLDIAAPGFRAAIAGHEIRLSQILLTALARWAMERRLGIDPIEPARLSEMRAAIMTHAKRPYDLRREFQQQVDELLERRLDEPLRLRAAGFVNSSLNMLREELAGLDPAQTIDPRFIRAVMIRRG
ncbi:MAG TPA: DUF6178 family protein [Candidatus Binataceae bacterium]|nr:DUF6178 family protein [Candidatus Binataceae bacterium]